MTTAAKTGTFFGRVLKQVVADGNDFVVHTGDVVEWSKYEDFWQNMLDENFDCLSVIPVQSISGNHETTYKNGINETYKHFSYAMPDQPTATGFYYSFSYADVKFIMLNTNRLNNNALTDDQYNWLEGQLKNKTEKWTVVAMHNPVYSAGTYGSKPGKTAVSDKLKTQLGKIFAEYGVDIVLQGHDHCVSRTYPINGNQMPTADTTEIYDGIEYLLIMVDAASIIRCWTPIELNDLSVVTTIGYIRLTFNEPGSMFCIDLFVIISFAVNNNCPTPFLVVPSSLHNLPNIAFLTIS